MLRSSNPILSKKDAFTPAAPQYGQSGYGRFSGVDGYREMTRVKSVQFLLSDDG